MSATLSPRAATGELERYLRVLAGPQPARRLLDVRYARAGGLMAQRFLAATHPERAARLIRALVSHTDVYTAVLLSCEPSFGWCPRGVRGRSPPQRARRARK